MAEARLPLSPDALEAAAKEMLPPMVYDYYAGGAEDEVTLRANRAAYRRYALRPRVLVDVRDVDTSVELVGTRLAHPVLLAPTAFQRLAHPDGELATARAARRAGSILVASSLSTCTIEEIAAEAAGALWFQLYVFRDRELTRDIVQRAEAAGATALALTVTVPVQGRRERDAANAFRLPAELEMANFRGYVQARFPDASGSALEAFIHGNFDASLTWDVVAWLRSVTRLPVLIKGVLTEDDGRRAVESGANGIIVSNHGGRQLDGALPTAVALPGVVAGVAGRVPVLVDGGVRRGSDVLKALALGASAVLVGRPYLWALALAGEDGVVALVEDMVAGLRRTMSLTGRLAVQDITADILQEIPWMAADITAP
jgi:isopentenyl diphosphate isomerase/L-lactate dehydrogenase-like FMN-dependent dehydrogenase